MTKLVVVSDDDLRRAPKRMPLRWESIRLLRALEECGDLPPAVVEAAAELKAAVCKKLGRFR